MTALGTKLKCFLGEQMAAIGCRADVQRTRYDQQLLTHSGHQAR